MFVIDFIDKHTWIPSVLTIGITASLAIWQIGRQFQNTVESQRKSKLDDLHLKIYDQIADAINGLGNALTAANSLVYSLPHSFEHKIWHDDEIKKIGLPSYVNIRERSNDLYAKKYDVDCNYLNLLSVIDKYELAFSDFGTMRIEINNKFEQLTAAYLEFSSPIYIYLPVDVEKEDQERLGIKIYPAPMLDEKALENMKNSSRIVCELITDLIAYIHDLRIETQNTLISHIFDGKKVLPRNPPDPTLHKVLSVDKGSKIHMIKRESI